VTSPTLSDLIAKDYLISVSCMDGACEREQRKRRKWGRTIWPSQLVNEKGLSSDTTLEQVKARLVCDICGSRDHVQVHLSDKPNKEVGRRDHDPYSKTPPATGAEGA